MVRDQFEVHATTKHKNVFKMNLEVGGYVLQGLQTEAPDREQPPIHPESVVPVSVHLEGGDGEGGEGQEQQEEEEGRKKSHI